MTTTSSTGAYRPLRQPLPPQALSEPQGTDNVAQVAGGGEAKITAGGGQQQQQLSFAKSWNHFVAGACGGMVSATITAPLDVLRTRLQSDYYQSQLSASRQARGIPPPSSLPILRASALHIQETFQILFAIPRVEGYAALFKGLGPNLIGVVPARSINFYTYGNLKKLFSNTFNNGQESAAIQGASAICAGLVTGTATNPIWVIKTRLQLDKANAGVAGGRKYNGVIDCTLKTVKYEGIKGLYRGLSASFLGVSESTMHWVLYEQGKAYLRRREGRRKEERREETTWDDLVRRFGETFFAGSAKLAATAVTYPHEVVRTRLRQSPTEGNQRKYTGLVQCFKLIWKEEGFLALYGGLVPHILRVVPSAAIMFGTYEAVLRLLGDNSGV